MFPRNKCPSEILALLFSNKYFIVHTKVDLIDGGKRGQWNQPLNIKKVKQPSKKKKKK